MIISKLKIVINNRLFLIAIFAYMTVSHSITYGQEEAPAPENSNTVITEVVITNEQMQQFTENEQEHNVTIYTIRIPDFISPYASSQTTPINKRFCQIDYIYINININININNNIEYMCQEVLNSSDLDDRTKYNKFICELGCKPNQVDGGWDAKIRLSNSVLESYGLSNFFTDTTITIPFYFTVKVTTDYFKNMPLEGDSFDNILDPKNSEEELTSSNDHQCSYRGTLTAKKIVFNEVTCVINVVNADGVSSKITNLNTFDIYQKALNQSKAGIATESIPEETSAEY